MHKGILLAILFILPWNLVAQLQELEVTQIETPDRAIPVFREYPEASAIIIQSTIPDLQFDSNIGIVADVSEPGTGEYRLIIQPMRQTITVGGTGLVQLRFNVNVTQARQVLFYTVEKSRNEVQVLFRVDQPVAKIFLDGVEYANQSSPQPVQVGTYALQIEAEGFQPIEESITINAENTFFEYAMQRRDPVILTVTSKPAQATVLLDGVEIGQTDATGNFQVFRFPDTHELEVTLNGYLSQSQQIQITEGGANRYDFELVRNIGTLKLDVLPNDAQVLLDKQPITVGKDIELTPGIYNLEIIKQGYDRVREKIEIELGNYIDKVYTLEKNTGTINIIVYPSDAEVLINRQSVQANENVEFAPGLYRVEVMREGFAPITEDVTLERGVNMQRRYELVAYTGRLQYSVTPSSAETVLLDESGKEVGKWTGLKIINDLKVGSYKLKVKAEGYKSNEKAIKISRDILTPITVVLVEGSDVFVDIDGNEYKTIKIGDQIWMAENLRTTRYRDGTLIQNVQNDTQWERLKGGAWSHYDNNTEYDEVYGKLYNWYAINNYHNLCPTGWHVPTDTDWNILVDSLGGDQIAGSKLKQIGTSRWLKLDINATNEIDFTALPGGSRAGNGSFLGIGYSAYWWTASSNNNSNSWYRRIVKNSRGLGRLDGTLSSGMSVRCVSNE